MAATLVHGVKIEIYPSDAQRQQFDLWRCRSRELWNLLRGIEQAAYSGEKYKPNLAWRQIWADVVRLNHEIALRDWETGKTIRMGKAKGKVIPPRDGPPPDPPGPEVFSRIAGKRIGGKEPGLFLWENDLLKVMARLKKHPQTAWIGDLHSHGCQAVCKDIVKALKAFLREKKKAGGSGEWGFPKFKKAGYATGSVYFANTQVSIDWDGRYINFSNGGGRVKCGNLGKPMKNPSLREARIWREGERWFMSAQFAFEAPAPRAKTGRECGVKVAASAIYTIFDGERFVQHFARKYSARDEALAAIDGRRASRKRRKSKGWFDAQSRLAKGHAYRRNVRSDIIHKGSRAIADAFDTVTIDKMDVKSMMRKNPRRARVQTSAEHGGKKPARPVKRIRKFNANAAMYDAAMKVEYKVTESGGSFNREHVLFPSTQICVACGDLNEYMSDGRMAISCRCGNRLQRQKNASGNIRDQGKRRRSGAEVLAAI